MTSMVARPVERARITRRSIVLATSWILMTCGILSLAYAGYVKVDASAYQAIAIRRLELSRPALQPRILAEGDVIGEILVPHLHLKAIVVQGDSSSILRRAVATSPKPHYQVNPETSLWPLTAIPSFDRWTKFGQAMWLRSMCADENFNMRLNLHGSSHLKRWAYCIPLQRAGS